MVQEQLATRIAKRLQDFMMACPSGSCIRLT